MGRRDNDLTSLAALAGLAYMMNKDKKDTTGGATKGPSADKLAALSQATKDNSMRGGPEEETAPTGMGDATKFVNAGTSDVSRPTPARVRSAAMPASNPDYGNEGRRPEAEKPVLKYQSLQDRAKAYADARAAAGAPGMYGTPTRREALPTASDAAYYDREYKKGGKVSAKPKASAPKVSSASRRADGIATKGKTRGRYL